MNDMMGYLYTFIFAMTLLLSTLGLWFAAIIPGIDRWSKCFFMGYFGIFLLCCLTSVLEMVLIHYVITGPLFFAVLMAESLVLSVPLPMLTTYLLHSCGEDIRSAGLFRAVLGLWAVYLLMIAGSSFIEGFIYVFPDNRYFRGPLYPLLVLPLILIQLLSLMYAIRHQARLSRKILLGFLVALVPTTAALIMHLFEDVFPLIDTGYILAALSMYSFALSDQIEQDRRHQREILRQQQEIAHERASVMVLQMRPHFIYNTLMTIYSLCNLDPQKARQVTMDFTNYLRKNFNAVASDSLIPFSTELEHTRAYLAVEQAQFEDMLLVDYDTAFTRFRLPPMTLQPIVENAVKHGMNPYSGPLHVSIRTQRMDSGVQITVEDNGPGFDPSDESKPHPTLTNIRQRLEMMCSGSMIIRSRSGEGTVVSISIPRAQLLSE